MCFPEIKAAYLPFQKVKTELTVDVKLGRHQNILIAPLLLGSVGHKVKLNT